MEDKGTNNDIIEERKRKFSGFLKQKKEWFYYLILVAIVWIGVYIRTLNISKLKDVTTGTWTLGPDLDPFLFLRWAEYIVEHGKLMVIDTMRYVPFGYDTSAEMKLLSYMIAWFHNFLSFFSLSNSVTYSAIIFPVFMFAITIIVFFLFARKIFYKESVRTRNIIALIATLLFVLTPSLLSRTIAGIPEKESAAWFFMFLSMYLFIEAFTSEKMKRALIFGILSGITIGLMALVWGGVTFVFLAINVTILFAFLIGKIDKKGFYTYGLWLLSASLLCLVFSSRYDIFNLLSSISTGSGYATLFIIFFHLFVLDKIKIADKVKIPKQLISLVLAFIVVIIIASILFGPMFIPNNVKGIIDRSIHPLDVSRFGLTVAENKQPYFTSEWKSSFGPLVYNIPLFFWLFFIGSVFMFNYLIKPLEKRDRFILTSSYLIFLLGLIFSKYAPHPNVLDGEGNLSLLIYFGGVLIFAGNFAYIYFKEFKKEKFEKFKEFNFTYILYFITLTLAIVAARGAVRLVMVLAAVTPVVVAFLSVKTSEKFLESKEEFNKFIAGTLAVLIIISLIFTCWQYYQIEKSSAENFAPIGMYNVQWQKAMGWIRDNTPENAVFGHWWDYGYWVQSIGERATILDGGNSIVYWDYLMGRNVLTGTNERDALEFLYAHNGTHLLIDSTDIGKYSAFSSIGSDENYDRFSWIVNFVMNEQQTYETNNETSYIYIPTSGTANDEDIIWNSNGKEIFLPQKKAAIIGIILKQNSNKEFVQPEAVFYYNGQQYNIPLRYLYYNNSLKDFNTGLDAGIFAYPKISIENNNQIKSNSIGAALYLSKRTIHSNLANLYLFDKKSDNFRLVHTEQNPFVEELKTKAGLNIGDFIYYGELQGPIKIWEINYPSDIKSKPEYLQKDYPNDMLRVAKKGEYSN
ncbi:MAG: STT3 domain-containing protein [archaeon]|nr:STT3 domain-containing protein [archaeon]